MDLGKNINTTICTFENLTIELHIFYIHYNTHAKFRANLEI